MPSSLNPAAPATPAPPSDFFGGFDSWLSFRVQVALERSRASLASVGYPEPRMETESLLLRARPLREGADGSGLWALCDGERAPIPLLMGPGGRWAAAGSSWVNGDPQPDFDGSYEYPHEDGMIELLCREILRARELSPHAPFVDVLITREEPVWSAPFGCAQWSFERWDDSESEGAPSTGAWPEDLNQAWSRLLSEAPGAAALDPLWREAQGERRVSIGLTARALTELSIYDLEKDADPDCNLWGQSEESDTQYWLIEPDGAEPFLFKSQSWQEPYHQLDEVRHGRSLQAKGHCFWSESWDMDNGHRDPENLFTRLAQLLPPVTQRGFHFTPGEPARIELPPMFEADAEPWLSLLAQPWDPSSEEAAAEPALLAMLEASLVKQACSGARPTGSPEPRARALRV